MEEGLHLWMLFYRQLGLECTKYVQLGNQMIRFNFWSWNILAYALSEGINLIRKPVAMSWNVTLSCTSQEYMKGRPLSMFQKVMHWGCMQYAWWQLNCFSSTRGGSHRKKSTPPCRRAIIERLTSIEFWVYGTSTVFWSHLHGHFHEPILGRLYSPITNW